MHFREHLRDLGTKFFRQLNNFTSTAFPIIQSTF